MQKNSEIHSRKHKSNDYLQDYVKILDSFWILANCTKDFCLDLQYCTYDSRNYVNTLCVICLQYRGVIDFVKYLCIVCNIQKGFNTFIIGPGEVVLMKKARGRKSRAKVHLSN
jgi:hypothetical protein